MGYLDPGNPLLICRKRMADKYNYGLMLQASLNEQQTGKGLTR